MPDSNDVLGMGPVLDQELSRLPAKYRAPLVLCYLRGQTHDQAARELRCPVGTVRSRMARGRDLLKRRLTRQGYAPTAAFFGPGLDCRHISSPRPCRPSWSPPRSKGPSQSARPTASRPARPPRLSWL